MAIHFQVAGNLETCAPNDAQITFNTKRSNVSDISQLPRTHRIHTVLLCGQLYLISRPIQDKCTDDVKMTLNFIKGQRHPICILNPGSQISPYSQLFSSCRQYVEKNVPNDSKMKVKGTTYGWYNYTPKSQILFRVGPWPAVFELQATMRQVHWSNDSKMTWWNYVILGSFSALGITRRWKIPYISQLPPHPPPGVPNLTLWPAVFELQAIDMCTEWPHMTLNNKRSVTPYKYNYSKLLISILFTLEQLFLTSRSFWDKCSEWPQNDLEK